MKKILTRLLLCSTLAANAQLHIEKSAPLDHVPRSWYNKILLLKSGKTARLRYSGGDVMHVYIYGQNRALEQHADIQGAYWDGASKDKDIDGAYEINREIVVFVRKVEERRVALYRLRINEDDGQLIKEEEIASKKVNPRATVLIGSPIYALRKTQITPGAGMGRTVIRVIKDLYSDCYAVVFSDNLDEEAEGDIKVIHFDGQHRMISQGHIRAPEDVVNSMGYVDGIVNGNAQVFIATYFKGSKKNASKVYLCRLRPGDSELTKMPLSYTEYLLSTEGQMCYNSKTNKIELLTYSLVEKKLFTNDDYKSFLSIIDPADMGVRSVVPLGDDMINSFARTALSIDADFSGAPWGMTINNKNETVVYKQEVQVTTLKDSRTYSPVKKMGDIGLSKFDMANREKKGYYLPFRRFVTYAVPDMYMKQSDRGQMYANPENYSFKYFSGEGNEYVLVNNFKKSIEGEYGAKITYYNTFNSALNTELFVIKDDKVSRSYLFDKPGDDDYGSTASLLDGGDYVGNVYATIVVNQISKDRATAQIVWIEMK